MYMYGKDLVTPQSLFCKLVIPETFVRKHNIRVHSDNDFIFAIHTSSIQSSL